MKSYLLYLPSEVRCLDDLPQLAGLLQPHDAGVAWVRSPLTGPDGHRGRLGHWRHDDAPQCVPHLVFEPDSQEWHQVPDTPLWIGWKRTERPTEAGLRRATQFAGYQMPLADGTQWLVPSGPMLPQRFAFANGHLSRVTKPAYESLYDSTRWAFRFASERLQRDQPLAAADELPVIEYVGRILSHNYRLTWQIAVILGLLQPQHDAGCSLWELLLATTSIDELQAVLDDLQKKTAVSGGNGPGTANGELA